MPRLRVKNGPSKGMTFEIGEQPLLIGRDQSCSIQIMDKGASRQHAEVFRIGEMCFIRDLESRNGTFVNDARLDEELLREGDRIQIGATILVFESSEAPKAAVSALEFSEEEIGNTLELRLEDLSVMNVDGSEAQRLRALYKLGRIVADAKEEEELIQKALPFIGDNLRADCAYLFTRDPQKGNIVPIGTHAKGERKGGKISRSIIRRAIQEKRAVLTTDAMQDNRFSARDSIVLKQIHGVICVPLSVSGDLQGVLYVAGDNPSQVFSEEDLELAAAMADQIGLAISHLRAQVAQRELLMSTIRVLVRAAELRDPTGRGHSERVAAYAVAVGRQMRLAPPEVENLQLAALLHDIGAIAEGADSFYGIGQEASRLTPEARRVRISLEIVKEMACYKNIEEGIRYQLEREDGSGPEGLKGAAIPLAARILAVAHEFDVRVNTVGQKPAGILLKEAVIELGRQAGRKFDEEVVKALLIAHRNGTLHQPLEQQMTLSRLTPAEGGEAAVPASERAVP